MIARILIVEDEPALGSVMAAYLERFGYAVDTALTTENAWSQFCSANSAAASRYSLMIVDMSMSGYRGGELAQRVVETNPDIRLIATSGYPFDPAHLQALGGARIAFLQKPFSAEMLVETIERLLNGSTPSSTLP